MRAVAKGPPARRRVQPILLASAAMIGGAAPALAQSEAPAPAQIQDIVVTAQRRSESLQNVPVAVTALSGDALGKAGIASTAELVRSVPGLNFNTALGGYGQPRIRSVGTTGQGPGIENPVATYIDGVYMGSSTGALTGLSDVAQVAVLKGPQGTLFGRNATGGLIQITTRAPGNKLEADATATAGAYQLYGATAFLSGPISDTLGASLAASYEDQGKGFGRNLTTGQDVQTHNTGALRGKLVWRPDAATHVTLSGDYAAMNSSDPALRNMGNMVILNTPTPGGPYDIASNVQPRAEARGGGASLAIQHDFNAIQITSTTAWRKGRFFSRIDGDQTPIDALALELTERDRQFSQELQLLSKAPGPLKWVVGLYYFNNDGRYDPIRTTGNFLSGGTSLQQTDARLQSYSAYGQATYALAPDTNLTGGLRYTIDHRAIDATGTFQAPSAPAVVTDQAHQNATFRRPSWRLSLDHRFSPELLGYLSYNRGFKSGTFTPQFAISLLQPEVLDAYEAGIKSDLFDRRLRINLAGFYYDYQNIQVNQFRNGLLAVYNARGAHTYGLDADMQARISSRLSLNGGLSLLHARYTSFDAPGAFISTPNPYYGGNTVTQQVISGTKLQNTPEFTVNLGATYEVSTPIGSFALVGGWFHNGGYFTAPENRLRQAPYDLLDASLTWTASNGRLSVKVWGKNLSNALSIQQLDATDFGDNRVAAPPRTYGVTAGVHF